MNETGRRVREQYADTGGFTDHVFAACSILGHALRVRPAHPGLPSKRLYVFERAGVPKHLRPPVATFESTRSPLSMVGPQIRTATGFQPDRETDRYPGFRASREGLPLRLARHGQRRPVGRRGRGIQRGTSRQ